MNFQELNEFPSWIKPTVTFLLGAGGAKLLAMWLESRRLEKKEYRDTLLGRIRELEGTINSMQTAWTEMNVEVALLRQQNMELSQELTVMRRINAQQEEDRRSGGTNAHASDAS